MALYAISDLHLAFDLNKPMDIFGNKWIKHEEKIKASWMELVNDDDLVLIAGDISWGINQSESYNDLWELLSLENRVNKSTPPAFLWHTFGL